MKKVMILLVTMLVLCITVEAQFEPWPVDDDVGYNEFVFNHSQDVVIVDEYCIGEYQVAMPLIFPMQSSFTNYDITINYYVMTSVNYNAYTAMFITDLSYNTWTKKTNIDDLAYGDLFRLDVGELNAYNILQ